MGRLPKLYIKIARDITGYWGAYPPSYPLAPGMIGKPEVGAFVRESSLERMPGYDPVLHAVQDNAVSGDAVSVWTTRGVKMQVIGAEVTSPVVPHMAGIKFHFGGRNEAAIICNGNVYRGFTDLRPVKDLMRKLWKEGNWTQDDCLVTEVFAVKSAWIFFSTEADQTAEIKADVQLDLSDSALPENVLSELLGRAKLGASSVRMRTAGISAALPEGGTPLFQAIRFKIGWWESGEDPEIRYVRGYDAHFEEPPFGEV